MKHLALPVAGLRPVTSIAFAGRRRSLFVTILRALHHTRQIQARRVLKQYQHLFDRAAERRAGMEDHDHVRH